MTYFLANAIRPDTRVKWGTTRERQHAEVRAGKWVGASPPRDPFSGDAAARDAWAASLIARDDAKRAERAKFAEPAPTHPATILARHIAPIVRTSCTECGLAFEVTRRGSTPPTVCSAECKTQRKRRWLREWKERKREAVTLSCVICGTAFPWHHASGQRRKTCSDECRGKHLYRSKVARRGHNPRQRTDIDANAFVASVERWAAMQDGPFTAAEVERAFPERDPLSVIRAVAYLIQQRRGVERVRRGVYRAKGRAA